MIPVANGLVNIQDGVLAEQTFGIKVENMEIIFSILRSQIYSDEPRAVIREISTNACDSHIVANKRDMSIQVFLPTQLEPFLKIRDFGLGLTDDEVLNVYTSYGLSTKREDKEQNGLLGIGCKSPFCYTESFLINSYKDGTLTVFNAYLEPSNEGKMGVMAKNPTTEINGIEVVIPIKAADVDKFRERALEVYAYFDVMPNILNITEEEKVKSNALRNPVTVFQGEGWKFTGKGQSVAVMSNVAYPIDADVFTDLEVRPETKELLTGGIIIYLKNGDIEFSASREKLKYSPRTKKFIAAKLSDISVDLMKQCGTTFEGCKSLWDAKLLYKNVFDFHGKMYALRNLFVQGLQFNGFKINNDSFSTVASSGVDTDIVCWVYTKEYNGKIRRVKTFTMHANEKHVIVENDKSYVNGIQNRLVGLLMGPDQWQKVYLISFASDSIKDKWIAETGMDHPMIALSSLPKEPMSKYFTNNRGSGNIYHNSKHFSKEFTYDGEDKRRDHSTRSEFWTVADVDLTNDEGVYVALDRFHMVDRNGNEKHPYHLREILVELKAAGLDVPDTIYGFKPSSVEKVESNPKWVSLWTWISTAVAEHFKNNPQLEQLFANRTYILGEVEQMQTNLFECLKKINSWGLSDTHPLKALFKKVSELKAYNETILLNFQRVATEYGKYICSVPPIHDIQSDFEAIVARYPLLFHVLKDKGYWVLNEDRGHQPWNKELEQYVTMVDLLTP